MKNFDKEFKRLLHKEGLDNTDVYFADYDTFEEIPLFSRLSSISFLSSLSFDEKNRLFLNVGMDLISYFAGKARDYLDYSEAEDYFICFSLTGWDDYEETNCLTPNIFLSRRKKWILSNLKLQQTHSNEERIVKEYLSSLDLNESRYDAYVSNGFTKNKRVYIVSESTMNQD